MCSTPWTRLPEPNLTSAPRCSSRTSDAPNSPLGVGTTALDPEDAKHDVVSDMRPSEARKLVAALLDLADRLEPPELP